MRHSNNLWPIVRNAVWHVTRPDRFIKILDCQALLPEPDIPNTQRWQATMGPGHYPFVRSIGGISLFDFRNFDPVNHARLFPGSSWPHFINLHAESGPWNGAIWLKLSIKDIAARMIWGRDLMIRRQMDCQSHRLLMPPIECAHIGPLSFDKVTSVVLASNGHRETIIRYSRDSTSARFRSKPQRV